MGSLPQMASIVIRGSWVQPLKKKEKECVQPHCMHGALQEEQCNVCVVAYTVLGQHEEEEG